MGTTVYDNQDKVTIFDVPFSRMGMDQTVAYLTEAINRKDKPHHVITANPIMVMAAIDTPEYMSMMQRAELVVPDGTGVVWAASYIGKPVAERVPGFELLHKLLAVGESHSWSAYLLGTSPDNIKEAAARLQRQFPLIKIVGFRDGFFKSDQDKEVLAEIQRLQPDLLFVARGADNQDPWINRYRTQLQIPLMMGVGGSFDIISGKVKRAPVIFQKLRLEWLHRLLIEPTRYKRMLALPKFVLKVVREKEKLKQRA